MRCRLRKQLFIKRNKICEISLAFGLAGLIFVIIDSEISAAVGDTNFNKTNPISLLLRSLCVLCTIALMASLVHYHSIEVKMALIDSGADDWRVALTTERAIKLAVELIVCAICPFPGTGVMQWSYIHPESRKVTMVDVPVDVILSVPMFLRAYLLCRFMVLHSKQFQDAATRSIAALNRISMDFRFVIKTMMADHPLRVLIVFTVSFWICMSWTFTQCERLHLCQSVSSNLYKVHGYGDIVPNTYCGRTLAITTGIVGAGVSSALIAVISRKLELSRAEKHVNNFMADSKLTNQRKNAAAMVLQQTWFIHKYKNSCNKGDELRLRHHQRRFLQAIYEFRRIKWDQRKLQERGNLLLDVGKLHNEMHETLWEMHRTQNQFITQMDLLTQKIMELQCTLKEQQQPSQQRMSSVDSYEFGAIPAQSTLVPTLSVLPSLTSSLPLRNATVTGVTDMPSTDVTDMPSGSNIQRVETDDQYIRP
uniref:Calmodulin-binding domain-containing protein n=1 Tax=Setaria digitata TaxID=48799 RepID=A0A915PLL9_9BILA